MDTDTAAIPALIPALIVVLWSAYPACGNESADDGSSPPDDLHDPVMIQSDYLDDAQLDTVGLLSPGTAILPPGLWSRSRTNDILSLLEDQTTMLPSSLLELLHVMLLAETSAPGTGQADGALLLARLDKLVEFGAHSQARELLRTAGYDQPDTFSRWLEISLILRDEPASCRKLLSIPSLSDSYRHHVYCSSIAGKNTRADSIFATARSMGVFSDTKSSILEALLNPDESDTMIEYQADTLDALDARILMEFDGLLPVDDIPPRFAYLMTSQDIQPHLQVRAYETLAGTLAIPFEQVILAYHELAPFMEHDEFQRVGDLVAFDNAVRGGDSEGAFHLLDTAFDHMNDIGIVRQFARHYSGFLAGHAGIDSVRQFLLRVYAGHIDPGGFAPRTRDERFLVIITSNNPSVENPANGLQEAILDGLSGRFATGRIRKLVDMDMPGEALLEAMLPLNNMDSLGMPEVQDAIAVLVVYDMLPVARELALELASSEFVQ